jgi:hypothetical protein
MGNRWRGDVLLTVLGAALASLGVATWAAELALIDPAILSFYHSWADVGGPNYGRFSADDVEYLLLFGKAVRVASILVAMAGVLLLLRGSRWYARLGWGLASGWLAADIVLDRLDVSGAVVAVVIGVAGAAVVAGLVVVGVRRAGKLPEYRPSATVYSGALVGFVVLIMPPTTPALAPYIPSGLLGMTQALSAALAFVAVVFAVTATATLSRWRGLLGLTVAVVCAAGALGFSRVLSDPSVSSVPIAVFIAVFGALPVVLPLLAGRVSPAGIPATIALAVLAPVLGYVAYVVAVYASLVALPVLALMGNAPGDVDIVASIGGLFAGALVGSVALIPAYRRPAQPAIVDADTPPVVPGTPRPSPARWL